MALEGHKAISRRGWRWTAASIFAAAALAVAGSAMAADKVRMGVPKALTVFPLFVAQDLKLFPKHGVDVEFVFGAGTQVANMAVSGATEFAGFAVEHGVTVSAKGQDVQLVVLTQTRSPFNIIVRNDVPTPRAGSAYPEMLKDLKGLKLAISTPGAGTDLALRYLLKEAGLDPQSDVVLVPIGGNPGTFLAGLTNKLVDGGIAFEPIQTEAVDVRKMARSVLDIEGGEGPEIFRDYAYTGVFAKRAFIQSRKSTVQSIVNAVVEAERMINDPRFEDQVVDVALRNMAGMERDGLQLYVRKYRSIFMPVATEKAMANVSAFLLSQKHIDKPVPYEQIVATEFMPKTFQIAPSQ